jgi:hypothetical protein
MRFQPSGRAPYWCEHPAPQDGPLRGVGQETCRSRAVDATPMRLHIAFAVPEAFFAKGGTMHSARKSRSLKLVSAAKSSGTSFFAMAEVCHEPKIAQSGAARSVWIEPRGMDRVPTHAVTVLNERRAYSRAQLRLPLRILRIAGHRESDFNELVTTDISSSGVCTRYPFEIEVGTPVHLEVVLVKRPGNCGNVRLVTQAQVVRTTPDPAGWHTVAFSFDEITFERDELAAPRFIHA